MRPEFWVDYWQRGQIGFHKASVEPFLLECWPALKMGAGSRVLVPLCGKSVDLLWLQNRGHQVVGIELSDVAVEAFFAENGVAARRHQGDGIDRYQAADLTLLRGDYFEMSATSLGSTAAVYDRAALISWAPEWRTRYVSHLKSITPAGTSILLITLEHSLVQRNRPPFSIDSAEVERLFSVDYHIREVARRDVTATEAKLRDARNSPVFEVCYHLKRSD